MSVKDDQVVFRCFECRNNYNKDFNQELIKIFACTYEFSDRNINKFSLLLRKEIYPYEYTDTWIAGRNLMKNHYLIKKIFILA